MILDSCPADSSLKKSRSPLAATQTTRDYKAHDHAPLRESVARDGENTLPPTVAYHRTLRNIAFIFNSAASLCGVENRLVSIQSHVD
jgi:hypothetical protein